MTDEPLTPREQLIAAFYHATDQLNQRAPLVDTPAATFAELKVLHRRIGELLNALALPA